MARGIGAAGGVVVGGNWSRVSALFYFFTLVVIVPVVVVFGVVVVVAVVVVFVVDVHVFLLTGKEKSETFLGSQGVCLGSS